MKKRLFWNIIELVLGGIMLFISYSYVAFNSAEKTNFISGIDVLRQKIVILFDKLTGKGNAIQAQAQQSMIRSYKELLSYTKASTCKISMSIEEIEKLIQELSHLTPAEYNQRITYYTNYASKLYGELNMCTQKNK